MESIFPDAVKKKNSARMSTKSFFDIFSVVIPTKVGIPIRYNLLYRSRIPFIFLVRDDLAFARSIIVMDALKNKPLVSVLICSFNADKFIESTLRSVLGQTYGNIEVLVLDNASHDNTVEVVEKLAEKDKRLKLYKSETNLGAYPGLNYLLERAGGAYIAINDHDDIWHPEKLERQVTFLEVNDDYPGCGSAILNWYEKYGKYVYRSQPKEATVAWHTSLVFRNRGYRYDVSVPVATDFHFIKNILCHGNKLIYNFPQPWVLRRIFGSANLSGRWMKNAGIGSLLGLKIGWVDKAALINRALMPQWLVEAAVIRSLGNRLDPQYEQTASFFREYMKI